MKHIFIFVLSFQYATVTAEDGYDSVVGAVIGSIAAILCLVVIFVLGYYCYRKNKQCRSNSRLASNNTTDQISSRNREPHNVSAQPPPSYFQNEYQTPSKKPGNVLYDQPPSYSTHMQLYHTHTSGQPLAVGNLMQGIDNPVFLNRSVSSFTELPSMGDILLTSSKLSIPTAIKAEERHSKKPKFSDSAQGDSIESRIMSNSSRFVFDNPQFSTSFEEDEHIKAEDVLNKRFESYTDSESEIPMSDMGGRWLDPIKNPSQHKSKMRQELQIDKPNKSPLKKSKTKSKASPTLEKNTSHHNKSTLKTRVESNDSGAEVSSNPRGRKAKENHNNETRISRISNDSGLGEATTKKTNSSTKSRKDTVYKCDQRPSMTTDV